MFYLIHIFLTVGFNQRPLVGKWTSEVLLIELIFELDFETEVLIPKTEVGYRY